MPGNFPSFNISGESPQVGGIEEPIIGSRLPLVSTISGGITPDLPFIFPIVSPASEISVSIFSSPFSIFLTRGSEPFLTFLEEYPFAGPTQASPF